MVVRLQKMMQSHCEEALSLLVANTANIGGGKVFDSHDHDAVSICSLRVVESYRSALAIPCYEVISSLSANPHSDPRRVDVILVLRPDNFIQLKEKFWDCKTDCHIGKSAFRFRTFASEYLSFLFRLSYL